MRKTLTSLVLVAALTGGVRGTYAEHVTPEELAFRQLQSQNVQEFANQFKQFTKTELTEEVLKKLGFWASAAPVAVGMAEKNKTKPTIHDPHHCKDDMCFEQWAYKVDENKFGLEKDGRLTKRVTTKNFRQCRSNSILLRLSWYQLVYVRRCERSQTEKVHVVWTSRERKGSHCSALLG